MLESKAAGDGEGSAGIICSTCSSTSTPLHSGLMPALASAGALAADVAGSVHQEDRE
ncbi:hypothetical protein JOS77_25425 [Chromobacterium haemolyticum]|nr:hypothetical protein JOS77_25425 [Chromobacterium haemolyticum]